MKKTKLTRKGITLIALIVTVTVLLILVGTAVTVAINGGDLFGKSKASVDQYNHAVAKDKTELDRLLDMINNKQNGIITVSDQNALTEEVINELVLRITAAEEKANTLESKITELESNSGNIDLDKIYPIGSIYMSIDSTDPSTTLGGTWERVAQGRTLVGVDTTDSDFSTVQKTGRNKIQQINYRQYSSTHTY